MLSNLLPGVVLDRLASVLSEEGLANPDGATGEAFLDQLQGILDSLKDGAEAGDPGSETPDGRWLQWAQAIVAQESANPVAVGGTLLPAQLDQGLPGSAAIGGFAAAPRLAAQPSGGVEDVDRARLLALAAVLKGRADVASLLEGASGRLDAGSTPGVREPAEGLGGGAQRLSSASAGPAAALPAGLGQLSGAPNPTSAMAQVPLPVPVDHARWGDALGQRIIWMANQDSHSASLQLNPRQLGPLEVRMSIEGDRAQLSFVSNHAAVRDAVETALPRLREMLGTVGLIQVDVNVSGQGGSRGDSGAQGQGFAQASQAIDPGSGPAPGERATDRSPRLIQLGDSLVDLYI